MTNKSRSHWLILVILALAQFMVVLDSSVVNVALPAIQHAFGITESSLQWIVTAYTLAFGGFLLLGGRAADLYGRKRIFLIGVTMFGISSLLAALAQNGSMLIVLRAVQGLSAAFMSPAALSIVLITYREGHERNAALAVWGAVASGGAAAGVLLGGVLTEYLNWRWNFFINIPVAIAVVVAAVKLLPAHEAEERHNDLDLFGAISVTSATLLLVYALTEAPSHGWTSPSSLIYFAISAMLLVAFVVNEQRTRRPLIPLSIFKIRNLTGANLTVFPVIAAMFSTFFFGSLYIQQVLGYSAVKTGLSFLVVPLTIAITATNIPRVIKRYGYKPTLVAGPILIAVSLFLWAHIPVEGSYVRNLLPAFILLGVGAGMSFVSSTIAATSGVPARQSGLASGLLNTAQQVGGSLGLAILSGVAASHAASAARQAYTIPTDKIAAYATVQGFHAAFYVGMGFAIAAALVAFFVVKETKRDVNVDAVAPIAH
ncbi:MAG: EmrB/QacA subfamily drug resistance transporter [Candidatus Saccharibacteria bacterium]|nr:EmrB/QacA subfamily drug resistance transporter [Candidatus Saccharibacteria bacterium]